MLLLALVLLGVALAVGADAQLVGSVSARVAVRRVSWRMDSSGGGDGGGDSKPVPLSLAVFDVSVRNHDDGPAVRASRVVARNDSALPGEADPLAGLGLVRLRCGVHLADSFPFPEPASRGEPPSYLVPAGSRSSGPWTGLQDLAELLVPPEQPAPAAGSEDSVVDRYVLLLQAAGHVSGVLSRRALEMLDPHGTPAALASSSAALESWFARECSLRYLPGDEQLRRPAGALLISGASGSELLLGDVALLAAGAGAAAPEEADGGADRALQSERMRRLAAGVDEEQQLAYWSCLRGRHQGVDDAAGGAASSEDDFGHTSPSFLELKARTLARMYQRLMTTNNMVAEALDPAAGALTEGLMGPIAATMDNSLVLKVATGLTKQITEELKDLLVNSLYGTLPPIMGEAVPDQLMDQLSRSMTDSLLKSLVSTVTPAVAHSVTRPVGDAVSGGIKDGGPVDMVTDVAPYLVPLLIKSLAHSVSASMRNTLQFSAQSIRCWYCTYNHKYYGFTMRDMCYDCTQSGRQVGRQALRSKVVRDGLYYAGYYSQYYAGYYAISDFRSIDEGVQNSQLKSDFWDGNGPRWNMI